MTPEDFKQWAEETVRMMRLTAFFRGNNPLDRQAFDTELREHDAEAYAILQQVIAASDKMHEAMGALADHLQRTHDIPDPPLPTADFSSLEKSWDPQAG